MKDGELKPPAAADALGWLGNAGANLPAPCRCQDGGDSSRGGLRCAARCAAWGSAVQKHAGRTGTFPFTGYFPPGKSQDVSLQYPKGRAFRIS